MALILLVDDDKNFTQATGELLNIMGHEVTIADNLAEAGAALSKQRFDILLLDLMLPDGSGFQVLENIPESQRPAHITIITGNSAVKSLVKKVMGPNISYLIKPIDLEQLQALIGRIEKKNTPGSSQVEKHFNVLIGESPTMHKLYQMIKRVAATKANVLLQGESGVGKELVANAIHHASGCEGAFVAWNCGAASRELIGSELFGHEKGAFTGAIARKQGLFEQADGGTLFLDEITEMPIDMQPNLLRVLETQRVTRLGGAQEIAVNCRVISATNRTTEQLAEEECLREDIYFRLAVFPIAIPPLRERTGDIELLAKSFLHELNLQNDCNLSLSQESLHRLTQYDWPGNVRELRHAIHRAFIMSDPESSELILPTELASPFARERKKTQGLIPGKTIEEVERELITLTLEQVDGDKPRAAEMLGVSLKTLYNRLNNYEKQLQDEVER
ncbi:sigma-54-dependent transcriptional regulator [Cellvibrio sp. ARAG 10.3]|uniref:sigma-54-dependent transcriptional regulator n=1 Tax=Cellvibrio sp. ARAG 10.3 TaxID=3451358 RepID=UPI003F45F730